MRFSLVTISLLLITQLASAQLVVDDTYTGQQLADVIVADGIFVTNVNLICPTGGSGYFDGTATNIGINTGVLLTSGSATGANGPNNDAGFGVCANGQGDPHLEAIAGETVFDACILEFDIVPTCTPLTLSYVFSSEEYPEYVNREFVDAMIFNIQGPNYPTPTNLAVVPGGGNNPVNIGTINSGTNSSYYNGNSGGSTTIQYDGFTDVLTATADVVPCQQYHIKIAVGDASDCIFDSGIFLAENSLDCGVSNAVTVDVTEGPNQPIEGCQDYTVEFCRQGSTQDPFDLNLIIEGTATNGVDYTQIPNQITLPAGVQCTTLTIYPFIDAPEGGETIHIIYQAISGGCQVLDTVFVNIADDQNLLPSFYNNDVCVGSTMFFNNTTTIDPPGVVTDFVWRFGDPQSGTVNTYNASYLYAQPGDYEVTLIATSTTGCVDSIKDSVYVYDYPTADFVQGNNIVCLGEEISFVNTSLQPSNDVIGQVAWNFGDGGNETTWDATHTYSIPDTFPVVLTVYSDILGCSNSHRDTVIVLPSVRTNFIFADVCEGNDMNFVNTSTGYDQNTQWEWNYGDGSLYGNTFHTTHLYSPADTYMVALVGITPNGCNDTTIKEVHVYDAPVAYFEVEDVCANELAYFDNLSTPPQVGTLGSWFWLFSDNTSASAFSPTHLFPTPPNNHSATLIVYNSELSCSDTFTTSLVVAPIPDANFTVSNVCDGEEVVPQNTTVGVVNQWEWDFGDGSNPDINAQPIHEYDDPGPYTIQLIATNAFGCTDSIEKPIIIYNQPVADFEVQPACAGAVIPFINTSYIDFPDNNVYWIWDYDHGGVIDTIIAANYTYPNGGTYFPELLVISNRGCRDSITLPLTVYHVPYIDVDVSLDEGCTPVCVKFDDLSTLPGDSMISWLWNFGDLNLSSVRNPSHCYGNDDPYNSEFYDVSLTIQTDSGCQATRIFDKMIEVYPQPEAEFDWTPDPVSLFDPTVTFIDQSLGASYWGWDFGQENISSDTSWFQEPQYTFTTYGDFPITLIVENQEGCRDTLVENIHIIPDYTIYVPNAFTPDGDTLNAEWGPKGFGVKEIEIRVFDRWGRLVFFSDDMASKWNGYDRSHQESPQGMYVYEIVVETLYKEVYNYSGKLMLMRRDD